jgi:hypothetical protein
MGLAIVGGIIAGSVGLGALYDYVTKRRGRNVNRFGPAPGNPSHTAQNEHNSFTV